MLDSSKHGKSRFCILRQLQVSSISFLFVKSKDVFIVICYYNFAVFAYHIIFEFKFTIEYLFRPNMHGV